MALVSNLDWPGAKTYAAQAIAIRRDGWPSVMVDGLEHTRWFVRPRVADRPGALWFRELRRPGYTSRVICQAGDMLREDFLAHDWTAENAGGGGGTNGGGGSGGGGYGGGGGGGTGGGTCEDCEINGHDRAWGDVHFLIGCGVGGIKAQFDDNVPGGEALYVGVEGDAGACEVWYAQEPHEPVPDGFVTSRVRIISPAFGEREYYIEDGQHKTRVNGGTPSTMTLDDDAALILAVPTSGASKGSFNIWVTPRHHAESGQRYFEWACTPQDRCLIPNLYGGFGVFAQTIIHAPTTFGGGVTLTGTGVDAWGIMGAAFGMTRASLEAPYTGRRWTMTPDLWRQYCQNLNHLGQRGYDYPWDPLMQLPRTFVVHCVGPASGPQCSATICCQRTIRNPLSSDAWVTIDGIVDDELLIDGVILEPGEHTAGWMWGGTPCNLAHAVHHTFWVAQGGSFTLAAGNNIGVHCWLDALVTFSETPPPP